VSLRLRDHAPFVVALVVGAGVRVAVQVAYPPAFIFSDGPTYLGMVDDLTPGANRPLGYGVLLWVLSWITHDVWFVAVVQHGLGLLTAVVVYAALRRWGVSSWVATLASLPVLLDTMQLLLEHSPLSDVLFDLLLVAGLAVLGWWQPPRLRAVAVAGVLLGLSVLVRLVAQPVVLAAALFCLLTGVALRSRVLTALVVCLAFALPLAAYMTWYHDVNGKWALAEASGRALYMRTTTFVDCDRIDVPSYERTLCPREPVGHRKDPTDYGWHELETIGSLRPPAGVTLDEATRDFALTAIRAQPADYVNTVLRDFALGFTAWQRLDYYDYDTAYKWSFTEKVDYKPTETMTAAYLAYGGEMPRTRHPLGDWLDTYGQHVYLRGPMLLVLVLVGLAGLLVRTRVPLRASRSLIFLTGSVALGLVFVPDATAEFVWRYQLPAVVLLPMTAALGWTRLRAALMPGGWRRRGRTARTAA
jgi:hypothetical protein